MKIIIRIMEIMLIVILSSYIILRWNKSNITVGDFFSLELLAILFWYVYDDFKTK